MHICFVSQEYPPETGWGGIGAYTYEMARGLAGAGHSVTVISLAVTEETIQTVGGVVVHRILPQPDISSMRLIWRLNRYWPGFAWAALQRVRQVHAKQKIDLIEAAENRADGFFISFAANIPPVMVRLHTAWIFVDQGDGLPANLRQRFLYWLEKRVILRANAVSSPSEAMAVRTRAWVHRPGAGVSIVPNPIDTRAYTPGTEARGRDVVFIGRLQRRKLAPLEQALPALLARCPETLFRFFGDDTRDEHGESYKARLMRAAGLQQHRLVFALLPREDVKTWYQSAALCLMPSLWENFPYTTLEAMACGAAVIASRCGGIPEMVEDGVSGILFDPGHPEQLVDAVVALLGDPARCAELGRAARQRVEDLYAVDRVVQQMLPVYQAMIAAAA